ncbi:hypothetical protein JST97_23460 [bacterium]|nr:hypothetical protein [bacterium]
MVTIVHVGKKPPTDDLVMELSALLAERKKLALVVEAEQLQVWLRELQRFRVACAKGDPQANWDKGRLALVVGDEAVAGRIAADLQASALTFVTRVQGILDESCHLISSLRVGHLPPLLQSGLIDGRMSQMIAAGVFALQNGVGRVDFGWSPLQAASRLSR